MNNEETILDCQETNVKRMNESEATSKTQSKGMSTGEKAAFAVGGAAIGAGMAMAGQAVASPTTEKSAGADWRDDDDEEVKGKVADDVKEPEIVRVVIVEEHHDSPEPEDAIVATATGVRVAQVDDNASFSQAFADARAQVGPGGVFEWHGRAYGTYYKDEWDSMTSEEKQHYQASIDYKDVLSDESMAQHHNDVAHHGAATRTSYTHEDDPSIHGGSHGGGSEEIEVQVLEVGQTDLNEDGIPENAAVLEINGHEVLIIDIDHDGVADAAIADFDNDGHDDLMDLEGKNIMMPEMSDADVYLAHNDGPDYMNDAEVGLYQA